MRRTTETLSLAAIFLGLLGCRSAEPGQGQGDLRERGPYLLVLGTAQDGGLPQIACQEELCREARSNPDRRRLVASLLIVDAALERRYLIDATPDLADQVELARDDPRGRRTEAGRPPLFDGIFLTHAHAGHYGGLLQIGPEAYGSEETRVFATHSMASFLEGNAPWSLLVERKHIALERIRLGERITLGPHVGITPIAVPHREEFSDTVAYVVDGPEKSALYLPDIDKWESWDDSIEAWIEKVDLALVDGTFFDGEELPGRDMAEIPHPFIAESLQRFAHLPEHLRAKIVFTHLNHSNPATDPRSPAARAIRAAGMSVATDGMTFSLGSYGAR